LKRRLGDPLKVSLLGEYVVAQPCHDTFGVFRRGFPEIEQGPDLGAMILDRAALPVVIGPHRRQSLRLLNEVSNHLL
jgi:hypothetical protein